MNFDRVLTGQEFSDLHNNGTVLCYSDISTAITNDCVYAPRMGNHNGNAGQELVDRSGSGITLSDPNSVPYNPTGALIVSDGGTQYNVSSMFLDDTNYLTAPSSPITSLKDADQTWSIRYKPDSIVSVGTEIIWSVANGATSARASRINKNGSNVSVTLFPTIGVTTNFVDLQSSVALVQDQWHTITVQIDVNNTLSITVDGVKDSVAMGNIDINATYPVAIGSSAGSFYCSGAFSAFRIWNRTISDAEVTENELNSNNVYVSYNDLSAGLRSGLIVDVDLGNYNGSNTPLVDNAGTLSFSEVGAVTYESELAVECNEAPV